MLNNPEFLQMVQGLALSGQLPAPPPPLAEVECGVELAIDGIFPPRQRRSKKAKGPKKDKRKRRPNGKSNVDGGGEDDGVPEPEPELAENDYASEESSAGEEPVGKGGPSPS